MSEKEHLVFVYGTLKQGFGNHGLLRNAEFIGKALTMDAFNMTSVGFPVLLTDRDPKTAKQVLGEVYKVDDEELRDLDGLEGEGRMYHRVQIKVTRRGGEDTMKAFVYVGDRVYWASHDVMNEVYMTPEGFLSWSYRARQAA